MRAFPSEEALVAAYWRRLARSIDGPSTGKRRKHSLLKSHAHSRVGHYLAASRNVDPAIPTGRPRTSHLRTAGYRRGKITPAIAG